MFVRQACFLFVALFAAQFSFAQIFTVKEIKRPNPPDDFNEYSFPMLQSTERAAIARKINRQIQELIGGDPDSSDPYPNEANESEFSYVVGALNERVVSLVIKGSHVGAGYHITRNVLNLDSRTGAAIDLKKLFGADGQTKLQKLLIKSWKAQLKSAVSDERFGGQYKACLAAADTAKILRIDRWLIVDDGIKFWAGSCLEGTTYEFEADVSQGPHHYSLGWLLPLLTPYGYSLFANTSAGPLTTLLRGKIDGKYAISLTLLPGNDANTIGGMIVYDRVGEPMNVNGTINGNQLVFHELDGSSNPLSDIEVSWDGSKLTGSFTNLKTKKQMSFEASVVK